jgi:hypothetical protein
MLSREDIIKKITASSLLGDLGLFVGGGFSKSVMNKRKTIALSWGDLIYKSLFDLRIDINEIHPEGLSYPELASQICHTLSSKENITFNEAVDRLKIKLAEITNWYPEASSRNEFGKFLRTIMPQWIITTNYDLILECLLPGMCITLGPEEQLFIPKKLIPVYHIHGIRTNPRSLVVTQEDYIRLFRPNEYRQSKLSLILKESTTLFIGYGLGDINVLSAVDWANNVFRGENHNEPPDIIQILLIEGTPRKEVYQQNNGTTILEVNSISNFFMELCKYIEERRKAESAKKIQFSKIKSYFYPNDTMIMEFLHNSKLRADLLNSFAALDPLHFSGLVVLISKALEKAWELFENPNLLIHFFSDFIRYLDSEKVSPVILELMISNINQFGFILKQRKELMPIWKDLIRTIPSNNLNRIHAKAQNLNYPEAENLLK